MKTYIAIPLLALGLASCTVDDIKDAISTITVPKDAKPSQLFTLNDLPAEPCAEYAQRIETGDAGAPFAAIELFADGHYILQTPAASRAEAAPLYGTYTPQSDKAFLLDNGATIEWQEQSGAHGTVVYTPQNGNAVSVSVVGAEPFATLASKALCRTWHLNTSKYWFSLKGVTALYRGYEYKNGQIVHEDNRVANFIGTIYEGDPVTVDRWPETITLSAYGTYFIRFASGKTTLRKWKWENEATGIIRDFEDKTNIADFLDDGCVTIRFAGDEMRIYNEYQVASTDILNVNSFTYDN